MMPSKYRPLVVAIAILAALGIGGYLYWDQVLRGVVSTDDARLAATMIDISPEIPGKLVDVKVGEGDHVEAGAVLFRLDDRDIKAQIAAAQASIPGLQAQVRIAEAQRDKAQSGARPEEIHMARTSVERLQTAADGAARELERARMLLAGGTATRERVENAQTASDLAQQNLEEAKQRLGLLRHGTRSEDLDAADAGLEAARAQVTAAQTALERAQLNLEHTVVTAPFAGTIVRAWRDPGENAAPGVPVITLMDPTSLYVSANIEESDLDQVHVGDHAEMAVDAFPGVELRGHVAIILDSTRSQFSAMPSEGVSGAFIKVTQRVPIKVELDEVPQRTDHKYVPGLSVVLHILTDTADGGSAGARASR